MWFLIYVVNLAVFASAFKDITDKEYYQMPKLFEMDNYEECLIMTGGTYCMGSFELHPATGNLTLYHRMQNYSQGHFNFNYTRLHRGFCMDTRCSGLQRNNGVQETFQNCVDRWTRDNYGLSARLFQLDYCNSEDSFERPPDLADNLFHLVFKCILLMNFLGTVYDIASKYIKGEKNSYLMAWSVRQNWRQLTDANCYGDFNAIRPLQFLRILGSAFTILGHVLLTVTRTYLNNPRNFELISQSPSSMILHNGTATVQMFTLGSNLILAYKILSEADKNPGRTLELRLLPKLLLRRIIRIAPSYWIAVAFAATWWPKMGSGPVWGPLVEAESQTCRQLWWWQLMFIANWHDSDGRCLAQTWSLAADLQLYVAAAALCLLLVGRRHAVWILSGLLVLSILLIFGVFYVFDFKSMMMVASPEVMRSVYKGVKSVSFMYLAPWASAPACLLGLLLGHIIYGLQKTEAAQHKKEIKEPSTRQEMKNTWIFIGSRSGFFIILAWLLMGNWVKTNASPFITTVYTSLERPVFSFFTAVIMYGAITKTDRFWYNLSAWSGWKVPGKVSLWVMLSHWFLVVSIFASRSQALHFTAFNVMVDTLTVLFCSYTLSIPLTVMIEMPIQKFLGLLLLKKR